MSKLDIAVYGGTFDPPTLGHEDIVRVGLASFKKIIVLIARNGTKTPALDEFERLELWQRIRDLRGWHTGFEVHFLPKNVLLAPYAYETFGASHLLRGVRTGLDMEYELNLAANNAILAPQVQTLLIPARAEHNHISSTAARDVMSKEGWQHNLVHYVSEPVIGMLRAKGHDATHT